MSEQKKKTAVQEMRELHEKIRKDIKPSAELIEIFSKKKKSIKKNETEKMVAMPFTPGAGA